VLSLWGSGGESRDEGNQTTKGGLRVETTIQISEVNSKDVKTSRGTGTVYNVKASDGREFSTFKKDLGQAAGRLRGQFALIEYSEVQKGEYTNLYLDSVTATDNPDPADEVIAKLTPTYSYAKDLKSEQINRSVAFKAAVELVAAGTMSVDGLHDLNELTNNLIPIVDGTYMSGNHTGDEEVAESALVKF